MDSTRRRKLIKDVRWSGWMWECFFWYRSTRVVPDKGHKMAVCACVRTLHCCLPLQLSANLHHHSVPQSTGHWQSSGLLTKIIINNSINLFFNTAISMLLISNHNSFWVLCDKIASVYSTWKMFIFQHYISPSVLWHCWLGGRKGIRPVKKLSGVVPAWLSVWS